MTIPLMAAALLLQLGQEPLPWRSDLSAARQECLKAGKPCVLLINVDRDTTRLGSVELHLTRSKEMRTLCSHVTVAIMRQYDPAGISLMKEFEDGYFGHCRIAVLDGKGELLAWFPAWDLLPDNAAETEQKLAANLVAKIEESLKEKDSLQELERRWSSDRDNPRALDGLLKRLTELSRYERATALAEAAASDGTRAKPVRNLAKAWTFPLPDEEASDEARARHIAEGEELLVQVARFEAAVPLLETLMPGCYGEQFDVPGKVSSALARLEKIAAAQPDPAPLRKRIADLSRLLREWKSDLEQQLKDYSPEEDSIPGARVKAMLGDAATTVKILGALPEKEAKLYSSWIREARSRLEQKK